MLSVVTPATVPAVTWGEFYAHRRLNDAVEQVWVESVLLPAVTMAAQAATNRQLINQTYKLLLDCFPYPYVGRLYPSQSLAIELPRAPLSSVTHVKYYDSDGTLTTWSSAEYVVDAPVGEMCMPGRVWPAFDQVWPTTRTQRGAVEVQFVAGYGAAATAVPPMLKAAMLMLAGHWFENRESVNVGNIVNEFPQSVEMIFRQFHIPTYRDSYEVAS